MDVHVLADYVFLAVAVFGAIGLWLLADIRRKLRRPPCRCHEDRYIQRPTHHESPYKPGQMGGGRYA